MPSIASFACFLVDDLFATPMCVFRLDDKCNGHDLDFWRVSSGKSEIMVNLSKELSIGEAIARVSLTVKNSDKEYFYCGLYVHFSTPLWIYTRAPIVFPSLFTASAPSFRWWPLAQLTWDRGWSLSHLLRVLSSRTLLQRQCFWSGLILSVTIMVGFTVMMKWSRLTKDLGVCFW